MSKNYYQILGLDPGANLEEIRHAFRLYSSKMHPDKHGDDKFFEERFKEILEAYEVLSDPEKKARYDHSHTGRPPSYQSSTTSDFGSSPPNEPQSASSEAREAKDRSAFRLPSVNERTRDVIVGACALVILILLGTLGNSGIHVPIMVACIIVIIRQLFRFGVSFLPD